MRETIRGIPLPFEFASKLAFPPENLVTLLVPNLFGEAGAYWGRGHLWEACLFVGVTGFGLAFYAAIYCERNVKWILIVIFSVALFLAVGVHAPLYRPLYDFVPGFNKFRSVSKFIFTASLFLTLLAATGLDRLLRRKSVEPAFVVAAFALAVLLVCAAWWTTTTTSWRLVMDKIHAGEDSGLLPQLYASPEFGRRSQRQSAVSLMVAAATCGWLGGFLMLSKRNWRALYAVIVLGAAEMIWFAFSARPTFDSASVIDRGEKSFLDTHPGDYRILNRFTPNSAMSIGAEDLWGYDASVVRRYAEFVAWSQGADPDKATADVNFTWADPLFAMVRLGFVLLPQPQNFRAFEVETAPLPHLQLVSKYQVARNRDVIFNAMRSPDFDPRTEVILEAEPNPVPIPTETRGRPQIVAASTDSLTIEVDTEQPAILLVTDVFASSWRAVPLPGTIQPRYQLQPANYILRAVPLIAGHHRLRVEYASPAFVAGKWISLSASIFWAAALWRFGQTKIPS